MGRGTCPGNWGGVLTGGEKKTNHIFACLRPISTDFWQKFFQNHHDFSRFLTIIWRTLIVLTILGNFVTIFNVFCINSCAQIEEHTHFYRFFCEKILAHIVRTYLSDLYREYPSLDNPKLIPHSRAQMIKVPVKLTITRYNIFIWKPGCQYGHLIHIRTVAIVIFA